MSSTFSNLKFELIGNGEQSGTWGTTTNTNIGTAIEQAVVGMATLDSGDFTANVATLTLANTNAAQDARALCLNIASGAVSAAGTVNVPAIEKPYIIINGSSFTVTVKVSGQTGVAVPAGKRTVVYNNGTDVGSQINWLAALDITTLNATTVDATNVEVTNVKAKDGTAGMSIADSTGVVSFTANPILSGGTANGVAYLNASKVLTTGSALTFDGTNFATTGTASATKLIPTGNVTAGNGMYLPAANTLAWSTNGSERMRIDSLGHVGIGDAGNQTGLSNGTVLSVVGANGTTPANISGILELVSKQTAASGNRLGEIRFANGSIPVASFLSNLEGGGGVNGFGANLRFFTKPDNAVGIFERMRIDSSGNVGIGTSSPTSKLHVSDTNCIVTSVGTGGFGAFYAIGSGTNQSFIFMGNGGGEKGRITSINDGALIFSNTTGATERMRIDASGDVGIGTSSPFSAFQSTASKLGIETPRASADQTLLSLAHTGTITANDKINIAFDSFSSTATRRTMAQISAMNENPSAGNPGSLLFYTNAGAASLTERLRIDSSGNVLVTGGGGLGYGVGSGGAVTQATSRTTGVTLNEPSGAITLVSAAGSILYQSFTVTNSTVAATDTVIVCQKSGTDLYELLITAVAAGSFRISFRTTGGTTTEQPVFNFAVIKAATT